jgi:uncharacterized protein
MTLSDWQYELESWLDQHHTIDDGAHDIAHFRRVWKTARQLNQAEGEQGNDLVLLAAAYLHDIISLPKDHPERHLSSRLAAREAESLLTELEFPSELIPSVCHAIEAHSFSAALSAETLEARLLQDADRMEALGAIGLARVFYTSGRMQRAMFDPVDPLAHHRPLDDLAFALDHFFVKLYKVADGMQTAAGKAMAERRRHVLERYVEDLLQEL